MSKYHVDFNGNTGVCKARKRCPFGDIASDHFSEEIIARRSYEIENRPQILALDSSTTEALHRFGPSQLPNRAWAPLSSALSRGRFTEEELFTANLAVNEEIDSLKTALSKSDHTWARTKADAEEDLRLAQRAATELSQKLETVKERRRSELRNEFGKI